MIRRVLDVLRRRDSQPVSRPLRPNELRRDVVQAERHRREGLRSEAAFNRQDLSDEQRPRRQPEAPIAPPHVTAEPWHVAALTSRSGLRRALVLKEILDPPLALRGPHTRARDA